MLAKARKFFLLEKARNIDDLDAPQATLIHREIIQGKPFLKKLYIDFYKEIEGCLPAPADNDFIVELGSGGGFIKEIMPHVVTSDIIKLDTVDMHFSATAMPFKDQSVSAFIMIDVLHHVDDTRKFFKEMNRCLSAGGKIVMIEPANTLWSSFIFHNFHHEPFDTTGGWEVRGGGPLTSANGAIPWIVFCRDRAVFQKEFPNLLIRQLKVHSPFRYLLSGGLTIKQLAPSFSYTVVKTCEQLLSPLNAYIGMFMTIELQKALKES